MKLKPDFEIVQIADEHIVVPVGNEAQLFSGVVAVSEEASFLLSHMQTSKTVEELIAVLVEEYEIDSDTARHDIQDFLEVIRGMGLIEEE